MFRTASPPHAPYIFPYELLFIESSLLGNACGGAMEIQAPESTVIAVLSTLLEATFLLSKVFHTLLTLLLTFSVLSMSLMFGLTSS